MEDRAVWTKELKAETWDHNGDQNQGKPVYTNYLNHILHLLVFFLFPGLIVGSLMLCWLPNQIRRLMMAAIPKSDWTLSFFSSYVTLHLVADTFFYLSSVLNPFLYNLSSRQFREVFLQVLQCHLTIEHVNRRNVAPSQASSSRSLGPLLMKSLRLTRASRTTVQQKPPPTFTTFQAESGGASGHLMTVTLTEEPGVRADSPSETEI